MDVGRPRGLGQDLAVQLDRARVLAHPDARGRVRDSIDPIVRLDREQPLDLLECLHLLVPREEGEHVVVAHGV